MEEIMRYFRDCDEFLKALWRFESYLTQCICCRAMWASPPEKGGNGNGSGNGVEHTLSCEEMEVLQACLQELNRIKPCTGWLAEREVFVSHGMCKLCFRDRIMPLWKKRQKKESPFDCFGTAVNGYCDQVACVYRDTCVVNEEDIRQWKERRAEAQQMTA